MFAYLSLHMPIRENPDFDSTNKVSNSIKEMLSSHDFRGSSSIYYRTNVLFISGNPPEEFHLNSVLISNLEVSSPSFQPIFIIKCLSFHNLGFHELWLFSIGKTLISSLEKIDLLTNGYHLDSVFKVSTWSSPP